MHVHPSPPQLLDFFNHITPSSSQSTCTQTRRENKILFMHRCTQKMNTDTHTCTRTHSHTHNYNSRKPKFVSCFRDSHSNPFGRRLTSKQSLHTELRGAGKAGTFIIDGKMHTHSYTHSPELYPAKVAITQNTPEGQKTKEIMIWMCSKAI